MADGVEAGFNATKGFVKNHWLAFAVVALVVVALAMKYDRQSGGKLSANIAKLPLVGSWFAS